MLPAVASAGLLHLPVANAQSRSVSNSHFIRVVPLTISDLSDEQVSIVMQIFEQHEGVLENYETVSLMFDVGLPAPCVGVWTLAIAVSLIDGPLPIGDFIAAGLLVGAAIIIVASTAEEAIAKIDSALAGASAYLAKLQELRAAAIAAGLWEYAAKLLEMIESIEGTIDSLLEKRADIQQNGWCPDDDHGI